MHDEATARRLAAAHGWQRRRDGPSRRRVVPSPEPAGLVELDMINLLAGAGAIVVCAGGGGIPVVADGYGTPQARFVEATGGMAAIGRLADARELLNRGAGTIITPEPPSGSAGPRGEDQ